MRGWATMAIATIACLPLLLLAVGVPVPWLTRGDIRAKAKSIPAGDVELAWLHTTTNAATWERFVAGFHRAARTQTELDVDDSLAFPDGTSDVPEISVGMKDQPGRIRIRWYKLSNDATTTDWIRALAARDRAPLAIIGGGSSDRAADLARAMAAQLHWNGDPPLLFITTASADDVPDVEGTNEGFRGKKPLVEIYRDRTFRFCFTNRQMAEAVVGFVWSRPDLVPGWIASATLPTVFGVAATIGIEKPHVILLQWQDDPFSVDLREQFGAAIFSQVQLCGATSDVVNYDSLPFSIGGYDRANPYEKKAAEFIVNELRQNPLRRSLLVLPTVTAAARRVLRAVFDSEPDAGRRLVVVNGDGIAMNAFYRDGEFAWPVDSIPVPVILFAHANPVDWDKKTDSPSKDFQLLPPTSTEDVLLFSEIARIIAQSIFLDHPGDGLVPGANALHARIGTEFPELFDQKGNRHGGNGEYAIHLQPRTRTRPPQIEIWSHRESWEFVRRLSLPAARTGSGE
jgi:hypothetical protein